VRTTQLHVVRADNEDLETRSLTTMAGRRRLPSVAVMNLYGIFFIVLIPLLPAIVAVTIHPLLELREGRLARSEERRNAHPFTSDGNFLMAQT
jgi:hypothetical protein